MLIEEWWRPPGEQTILKSTKGVVFLATPHKGSGIASIARWLLGSILRGKNVRELKDNDPELGALNDKFRDLVARRSIKIRAFSENQHFGRVIVVQQRSASPEIAGVTVIPVDYDHSTICKPPREGNVVSNSVQKFVDACLRSPKAKRPRPDKKHRRCDAEVEQVAEQLVSAFLKLDEEIVQHFRSLNNFNSKWSKGERDAVAKAIENFAFKSRWINTIHESLVKLRLSLKMDVHPDDLDVITSLYETGTALLGSLSGKTSKATPFPSIQEMTEFVRIVRSPTKKEEFQRVVTRAEDFQMLITPALLQDLKRRLTVLKDNHRRRYPAA
jgi:hypothetical protein